MGSRVEHDLTTIYVLSCSIMSRSLWPTRLLLFMEDFPGKNPGVCCHSLFKEIKPMTPELTGRFFTTKHLGSPVTCDISSFEFFSSPLFLVE